MNSHRGRQASALTPPPPRGSLVQRAPAPAQPLRPRSPQQATPPKRTSAASLAAFPPTPDYYTDITVLTCIPLDRPAGHLKYLIRTPRPGIKKGLPTGRRGHGLRPEEELSPPVPTHILNQLGDSQAGLEPVTGEAREGTGRRHRATPPRLRRSLHFKPVSPATPGGVEQDASAGAWVLPDPQPGAGREGGGLLRPAQATVTTARAQQAGDCALPGGRGSQGCRAGEGAPLNSEEPAVGQQRPGCGAARSTGSGADAQMRGGASGRKRGAGGGVEKTSVSDRWGTLRTDVWGRYWK